MPDSIQEGDKVSWSWNGSHPSGTAAEVKPGDVTVTSHRGNDITKTGTKDDPAVHIERSGNDVVKTVSELKVEQKGEGHKETGTSDESKEAESEDKQESEDAESNDKQESKDAESKDKQKSNGTSNGHKEDAKAGDKRKAEESATKEKDKASEKDTKKQKTTNGTTTNGKKGPGRPKGVIGAKKEKKAPRTGVATRKTRSQGKAE